MVISDHPSPASEDYPHREALLPSPCALTPERFLVGEDDAGSDYLFHLFDFEFKFGVRLFDHGFSPSMGLRKDWFLMTFRVIDDRVLQPCVVLLLRTPNKTPFAR